MVEATAAGGDAVLTGLRAFTAELTARALAATPTGGDRAARVSAMEDLRAALAAAQAVEVAAWAAEHHTATEAEIANVPRPGVGTNRRRHHARRELVSEVATARRISPWQAGQYLRFAEQAQADLPATFDLLATGRLSEHRASMVFTALSPLDPEQRREVDAALAPDLPTWGDRRVGQQARTAVYRADPAGAVKRNASAAEDRRVSFRPAPDGMAWMTTLATVAHTVAARAQLERDVAAARAAGDTRPRGQIMSDTVIARILDPLGSAPAADDTNAADSISAENKDTAAADAGAHGATRPDPPAGAPFTGPVAIQLVITDHTLCGGDEPARFADGEPYPAPSARDLALGRPGDAAARRVRRLFADPAGRLVTAETASRNFTSGMADLVRLRDGICTTPWCDAPIADIDHHDPRTRGGPTSLENARGLCRWCNVTKGDRPPEPAPAAPAAPVTPPEPPRSEVERRLRRHLRRQRRRAARRRESVLIDLPAHR